MEPRESRKKSTSPRRRTSRSPKKSMAAQRREARNQLSSIDLTTLESPVKNLKRASTENAASVPKDKEALEESAISGLLMLMGAAKKRKLDSANGHVSDGSVSPSGGELVNQGSGDKATPEVKRKRGRPGQKKRLPKPTETIVISTRPKGSKDDVPAFSVSVQKKPKPKKTVEKKSSKEKEKAKKSLRERIKSKDKEAPEAEKAEEVPEAAEVPDKAYEAAADDLNIPTVVESVAQSSSTPSLSPFRKSLSKPSSMSIAEPLKPISLISMVDTFDTLRQQTQAPSAPRVPLTLSPSPLIGSKLVEAQSPHGNQQGSDRVKFIRLVPEYKSDAQSTPTTSKSNTSPVVPPAERADPRTSKKIILVPTSVGVKPTSVLQATPPRVPTGRSEMAKTTSVRTGGSGSTPAKSGVGNPEQNSDIARTIFSQIAQIGSQITQPGSPAHGILNSELTKIEKVEKYDKDGASISEISLLSSAFGKLTRLKIRLAQNNQKAGKVTESTVVQGEKAAQSVNAAPEKTAEELSKTVDDNDQSGKLRVKAVVEWVKQLEERAKTEGDRQKTLEAPGRPAEDCAKVTDGRIIPQGEQTRHSEPTRPLEDDATRVQEATRFAEGPTRPEEEQVRPVQERTRNVGERVRPVPNLVKTLQVRIQPLEDVARSMRKQAGTVEERPGRVEGSVTVEKREDVDEHATQTPVSTPRTVLVNQETQTPTPGIVVGEASSNASDCPNVQIGSHLTVNIEVNKSKARAGLDKDPETDEYDDAQGVEEEEEDEHEIKVEPEEVEEDPDEYAIGHRNIFSDFTPEEPTDELQSVTNSEEGGDDAGEVADEVAKDETEELESNLEADQPNPLQCVVCERVFKNTWILSSHLKRHAGEHPYQCDVCKKICSHLGNLQIHMRVHTGHKPFICDICSKAFKTKAGLHYHRNSHSGLKPYKCKKCDKAFTRAQILKEHMKGHEGGNKCVQCNKSFASSQNYKEHLVLHSEVKPFECLHCGRTFHNPTNLKKHARVHDRLYQCGSCMKYFKLPTDLEEHGCEVSYKCQKCDNCYQSFSDFERHLRIHRQENGSYQCEVCGKKSFLRGTHRLHMRIHSNERPFKCVDCNKSFVSSSHLTRHRRQHTGEKPYKCEVCDKPFYRHDEMIIHLRMHTGGMEREEDKKEKSYRARVEKHSAKKHGYKTRSARR